jgi:streptogramin lyase
VSRPNACARRGPTGRNRISVAALGFLAGVLLTLALAAPAGAYVYWAEPHGPAIARAENDGSGIDNSFITTGASPIAVTVNSGHIYWANQNGASIGRANIDGSGVDNNFITGVSEPSGVAVNGTHIYWSTLPGPIGRANLDGTGVSKKFITAAGTPCGVALDSGHVYWVDDSLSESLIGRAGLDGGFVQSEYVKIGLAFPCGVAVNSAGIFWSDLGFLGGGTRIGRADVATGKIVDQSFIGGAGSPCGVTLDTSSHLFWANAETDTIGRASSDGTGVNQKFIVTGGDQICGVAVDSLVTPPLSPLSPPPTGGEAPPSDTTPPQTKIAKGPGKKLAQGKAKFVFRSSEAGSTFACKLDQRKPSRCKSPKKYTGLKPGRHTFKVWATDRAGNKDPTPAKKRFRVPA